MDVRSPPDCQKFRLCVAEKYSDAPDKGTFASRNYEHHISTVLPESFFPFHDNRIKTDILIYFSRKKMQ